MVGIAHHYSHIKFGDMKTSVGNAHPTAVQFDARRDRAYLSLHSDTKK